MNQHNESDLVTYQLALCFGVIYTILILMTILESGISFQLLLGLIACIFTTTQIWYNHNKQ